MRSHAEGTAYSVGRGRNIPTPSFPLVLGFQVGSERRSDREYMVGLERRIRREHVAEVVAEIEPDKENERV